MNNSRFLSENFTDLAKILGRFTFLAIDNAFFSVDSFFLLRCVHMLLLLLNSYSFIVLLAITVHV